MLWSWSGVFCVLCFICRGLNDVLSWITHRTATMKESECDNAWLIGDWGAWFIYSSTTEEASKVNADADAEVWWQRELIYGIITTTISRGRITHHINADWTITTTIFCCVWTSTIKVSEDWFCETINHYAWELNVAYRLWLSRRYISRSNNIRLQAIKQYLNATFNV